MRMLIILFGLLDLFSYLKVYNLNLSNSCTKLLLGNRVIWVLILKITLLKNVY